MTASASGKGKIGLIVIIAVVVIALAVAATGGWMFLQSHGKPSAKVAQATSTPAPPAAPPVFFKLEPFTVNIRGGDYGGKLLYVAITLQLSSDKSRDYLQKHLPEVRNRLLMVLSDQDADALTSSQGKQKLASAIRAAMVQSFGHKQPRLRLQKVLFTQFILQ